MAAAARHALPTELPVADLAVAVGALADRRRRHRRRPEGHADAVAPVQQQGPPGRADLVLAHVARQQLGIDVAHDMDRRALGHGAVFQGQLVDMRPARRKHPLRGRDIDQARQREADTDQARLRCQPRDGALLQGAQGAAHDGIAGVGRHRAALVPELLPVQVDDRHMQGLAVHHHDRDRQAIGIRRQIAQRTAAAVRLAQLLGQQPGLDHRGHPGRHGRGTHAELLGQTAARTGRARQHGHERPLGTIRSGIRATSSPRPVPGPRMLARRMRHLTPPRRGFGQVDA